MKGFAVLFAILFCNISYAQKNSNSIIYAIKNNVFIQGIDNPVQIIKEKDDSLTILNGTLKSENGFYYINPPLNDVCIVTFWHNGSVIHEEKFRVNPFPKPIPLFLNYRNGSKVPVAQVKAAIGIGTVLENLDIQINIPVVNFDMIAINSNGINRVVCNGNTFCPEAKKYLQNAKPGQIFIFTNITATTPNGNRTLDSFFIEVN